MTVNGWVIRVFLVILYNLLCRSLHTSPIGKQAAGKPELDAVGEGENLHKGYSGWEDDVGDSCRILYMPSVRAKQCCAWEAVNFEHLTHSMHGLNRQDNLPRRAQISTSGDMKFWRHRNLKGHQGG